MRRAVAVAMALSWTMACNDSGQSGSENELKPDGGRQVAGDTGSIPDSGRPMTAGGPAWNQDGGEQPPDDGTEDGPPGRPISDRGEQGVATCEGTTLGEVIDAIHAAQPELADITQLYSVSDDGFVADGKLIYAFASDDGGFSLAFKRGEGDCPSGCTDNEWWYFATDKLCEPQQVGHYKPGISPEGCLVQDGKPMFGQPPAPDPITVCGADPAAMDISGSHRFTATGERAPCSFMPESQPVDLELTIEIAQDPDDLSMGTVTVTGTGNALIDGRALPAQIVRQRFSVAESDNAEDQQCIKSHSLTLSFDFEGGGEGSLQLEEVDTPDCASSPDYCKGLLSLKLTLDE